MENVEHIENVLLCIIVPTIKYHTISSISVIDKNTILSCDEGGTVTKWDLKSHNVLKEFSINKSIWKIEVLNKIKFAIGTSSSTIIYNINSFE